jgi:hypothetical protein
MKANQDSKFEVEVRILVCAAEYDRRNDVTNRNQAIDDVLTPKQRAEFLYALTILYPRAAAIKALTSRAY